MIKIAVTTRKISNPIYKESYNAISDSWLEYFDKIKLDPILFTDKIKNPVTLFNKINCSALILLNGEDNKLKIKNNKFLSGSNRDFVEYKLVKNCIKKKLPILGICRGHQFLNVFFGGKLKKTKKHVNVKHKIDIIDQDFIKKFNSFDLEVNSFHENCIYIKDLSKFLVPWAVIDNTVEGFYNYQYKIFSIMWHPERRKNFNQIEANIIKKFLKNK